MPLAHELSDGLKRIGVSLDQPQQQALIDYAELLLRWNQQYNLIGRSTEAEVVGRHLLDSLNILPTLLNSPTPAAQRWIDIGSGAGLPGIPMAIARPDLHFTLLDSNSKKTRFLLQVSGDLGLKNVNVVHSRVEEHHPEQAYNGIISRAWTAMSVGLEKAEHLGDQSSRWCFMKGQKNEQELLDVPKQFTLARCVALPSSGEARHLFEFIK